MNPPDGWGPYLVEQLGLKPYSLLVTVLSAVIIYVVLLLVIRIAGARILTATTAADAVVVIMLGAVAGRAILGLSPTVTTGVVALITLLLLEGLFGKVQDIKGVHHLIRTRPVLVFHRGKPVQQTCQVTRTSDVDLNSAMRRAGIAHPEEVGAIILEPRGSYSVIPASTELSPALFTDVEGFEHVDTGGERDGS